MRIDIAYSQMTLNGTSRLNGREVGRHPDIRKRRAVISIIRQPYV
jgi:hypothetical protein